MKRGFSAADVLTALRVPLAVLFPFVTDVAARLAIVGAVAASDFLDGVLARRGHGATRHGAVLDNLADIAFVLAGTVAGATLGLVPRAVPVAIAVAFAAYAAASVRGRQMARSAAGHTAGALNYALVGLIAGAAAMPGRAWAPLLAAAGWIVIGVNLAAVLPRLPFGARSARR